MKLRKGWHTYWKNPGDAGLPLRITWRLPDGFAAGPIEWPAPERIPEGPSISYGYQGEVFLPIEITPPDRIAADSVTIEGSFEWLECKDVCLPSSSLLAITLPVGSVPASASPRASWFTEVRSRMPVPAAGWNLNAVAGPRAISLAVRPSPGVSSRGAYLFVDRPLVVDHSALQGFERVEEGFRLTVPPAPNSQGPPDRLTGVLVLEARGGARSRIALAVDVPVTVGDPAPAPIPSRRGWLPATVYVAAFFLAGLGLALLLRRAGQARRS